MVRRLVLLRHGEAAKAAGQSDDDLFSLEDAPLSPRGRAEAEAARRLLDGERFDAVVASPALRARETATIVGGREPVVEPDLAEMPFWTPGADYATVLRRIVGLAFDLAAGKEPVLAGGERYADAKARFSGAIRRILAAHERPLVVAHGIQNRVFLADVLGMPPEALFRLAQAHAAVNVVDDDGDRLTVVALNRVPTLGAPGTAT